MSKYLDQFRAYLMNIEKSIADATSERHKAILRGYKKHACYEFGSSTGQIFTPEMTVAHPVYTVKLGRGATNIDVYDGEEPVKGFYAYVNSLLVLFRNENLWVNDWGLASRADLIRIVPGTQLLEEGVAVDDPSATYAESTHIAMFWPYDEQARLIGEHVYQLEEPVLEKMAAIDLVTVEQRDAISAEFLAREV
jgi:hypothetical protein